MNQRDCQQVEVSGASLWALGKSPIKIDRLAQYLHIYPNKGIAELLLEGFTEGFRLNHTGPRVPVFSKNMKSAEENLEFLNAKLKEEVQHGRMIGPFNAPPLGT